jgi:hypothetical protein
VQNARILDIGSGRGGAGAVSASGWAYIDCARDLPEVPVLLETLLLMELKAKERCVDLREISLLVMGDMGAVLQIFRRLALEVPSSEDRPARIEDCISSLGVQACLEALSSATVPVGSSDVIEAWRHAKEIAGRCRQISVTANTSPDEAYLAGLFHQLPSLPLIFGWGALAPDSNAAALTGLRMAEAWSLPRCVREYFCEMQNPANGQRWSPIVQRAHKMAASPTTECCVIEI